jgi:hypothetical protein
MLNLTDDGRVVVPKCVGFRIYSPVHKSWFTVWLVLYKMVPSVYNFKLTVSDIHEEL